MKRVRWLVLAFRQKIGSATPVDEIRSDKAIENLARSVGCEDAAGHRLVRPEAETAPDFRPLFKDEDFQTMPDVLRGIRHGVARRESLPANYEKVDALEAGAFLELNELHPKGLQPLAGLPLRIKNSHLR